MVDRICAMQISMRSRQSWMPPIDIKRFSMMAMTEIVRLRKELYVWVQ